MSSAFDFSELSNLIKNNKYIRDTKSNKNKDECSLKYLVDIDLSQSDCIKLGVGVEKFMSDLVIKFNKSLINIRAKNSKGSKETDLLFLDSKKRIVYYAELKTNINLDTEKSKVTSEKCIGLVNTLRCKYPDHEIRWCLLAVRYFSKAKIPITLKNKYTIISDNLYGVNEFLEMLNIDFRFDEEIHKKTINEIAINMFTK
jgi:hypothetical protein